MDSAVALESGGVRARAFLFNPRDSILVAPKRGPEGTTETGLQVIPQNRDWTPLLEEAWGPNPNLQILPAFLVA